MPLRFSPARGASVLISSSSRGPTGSAATVSAGTTTTGAEGTSAAVANSGSTSAAVFDFTIPRGAVPAIGFNFDTSTTDADPGAGDVRFNHATPASVTAMYFDNVDRDGNTVTTWLDSFDDSTTAAKGHIVITPAAGPTAKLVYSISGSVTDGTGYRKITVAHVSGTTLPSSAAHLAVAFFRTGDAGSLSGPASSTDNAIARWNGAGGISTQDSFVIIEDTGVTYPTTAATAPTLGTTSAPWSGLYLANAAPINFNNGDVTITHSTNALSFAGSTGYSFDNKIIALDVIELGHASDTTLARSGAGAITVEGVQVTLNTTAQAHTAASIELGHASDTTITRTGAGAIAVEGVQVALNSTAVSHTANTYEIGSASDTTLARVSAGIASIEGKQIATLSSTQNWTAQQYFGLGTITDGASITWDVTASQKAKVTLNGNRTMLAVTGAVEGATYWLWSIQDSTGSRTLTFTTTGAGSYDFGTDGAPTLSTTGSKADLLCFEALSYSSVLKLRFAGIKKGFT